MFPFPVFYPLSVKCIDSLPCTFCVVSVKNRLILCESSVFIFFHLFYFYTCRKDVFLSSVGNQAFTGWLLFWLKNCIYFLTIHKQCGDRRDCCLCERVWKYPLHTVSDSEPAGRPAGRTESDLHLHFPWPFGSSLPVWPGMRHVPGQGLRTGNHQRNLRGSDSSVYQIPSRCSSNPGSGKEERIERYAYRWNSKPGEPAKRLLLPYQMSVCDRALRTGSTGIARSAPRQIRCLPPCRRSIKK